MQYNPPEWLDSTPKKHTAQFFTSSTCHTTTSPHRGKQFSFWTMSANAACHMFRWPSSTKTSSPRDYLAGCWSALGAPGNCLLCRDQALYTEKLHYRWHPLQTCVADDGWHPFYPNVMVVDLGVGVGLVVLQICCSFVCDMYHWVQSLWVRKPLSLDACKAACRPWAGDKECQVQPWHPALVA